MITIATVDPCTWTSLRHVHGSQYMDLDPDPLDLDPRSQAIVDPSLCFVERSTGIIDPTNQFVERSTEIIELHCIKILLLKKIKQMM